MPAIADRLQNSFAILPSQGKTGPSQAQGERMMSLKTVVVVDMQNGVFATPRFDQAGCTARINQLTEAADRTIFYIALRRRAAGRHDGVSAAGRAASA
ncbi:hypothetical protein OJE16_15280 [Pantoea tagorei]